METFKNSKNKKNKGKTAITIQFVQGVFVKGYDPTIEDSYRKMVEIEGNQHIAGKKFCFFFTVFFFFGLYFHKLKEIIDTAGTEQFVAMRELHYRFGEGFMLIFSVESRESYESITEMRENILKAKEKPYSMVLIGNKIDLENRQVTKEEAQELARNWDIPYFECSAKECFNVNESFVKLISLIQESKSIDLKKNEKNEKKKKKCIVL